MTNFEDFQRFGQENLDAAMKSFHAATKGFQAIATEATNYSRKSFEDGTAAMERLIGVRSVEKAIEIQNEYVKRAYEGFVAEATKIGELYADLAKETYKPFEGCLARAGAAK